MNQDVQNLLIAWLLRRPSGQRVLNLSTLWKNTQQTPYTAVVGNKVKRELKTSVLYHEKICGLQLEEDLGNLINKISEEDVINKIASTERDIIYNKEGESAENTSSLEEPTISIKTHEEPEKSIVCGKET